MAMASIVMIPAALLGLAIWAGLLYLLVLLIRALRKYLRGGEARREKAETCRTLGEILKAHRMRCQMTQEFVAEALGVSRQAVSKWETGRSGPQHLQPAGPGEALRRAGGGAAAGDRRRGKGVSIPGPVTICNGTVTGLRRKPLPAGLILFLERMKIGEGPA